jgi:hypothetical protein
MTGDAVVCFGCGERFASAMLEVVGDTMFCRSCLGRMLRRVDERSARGPAKTSMPPATGRDLGANGARHAGPAGSISDGGPDRSPDRSPARTSAADAPCFVCGEPLDGDAVLELRGFAICARCAPGLLGEDPPADASLEDGCSDECSGEPDPADRADDASPRAAILSGGDVRGSGPHRAAVPPAVLETPGTGTEWCARCDRAMPGPGSYVLVDGRPHCPGCAAARQRSARSADEPFGADGGCDACGRTLGAPDSGPVPQTQGFRLCAACLSSDPELAVALARARHQRRLARATRRLLDGDDD